MLRNGKRRYKPRTDKVLLTLTQGTSKTNVIKIGLRLWLCGTDHTEVPKFSIIYNRYTNLTNLNCLITIKITAPIQIHQSS